MAKVRRSIRPESPRTTRRPRGFGRRLSSAIRRLPPASARQSVRAFSATTSSRSARKPLNEGEDAMRRSASPFAFQVTATALVPSGDSSLIPRASSADQRRARSVSFSEIPSTLDRRQDCQSLRHQPEFPNAAHLPHDARLAVRNETIKRASRMACSTSGPPFAHPREGSSAGQRRLRADDLVRAAEEPSTRPRRTSRAVTASSRVRPSKA